MFNKRCHTKLLNSRHPEGSQKKLTDQGKADEQMELTSVKSPLILGPKQRVDQIPARGEASDPYLCSGGLVGTESAVHDTSEHLKKKTPNPPRSRSTTNPPNHGGPTWAETSRT